METNANGAKRVNCEEKKSRKRKKGVEANVEIRAAPYKRSATIDIRSRISRAVSQRMYMVNQEDLSNELGLCRKYAVLGSTGNVYNIRIEKIPSCTCPDAARKGLCKHIIFIMVKVLQVPKQSELVYQRALLQTELAQIFATAPEPAASVQAKKEVVVAYNNSMGTDHGEMGNGTSSSSISAPATAPAAPVNEKKPVGDCPVCFEDMCGGEALESCHTCRNYLHKGCLAMWLKVQPTCCYCRQVWRAFGAAEVRLSAGAKEFGGGRNEGYVNLGGLQGQAERRDTSTYARNWRRGYGYYNDDEEDGYF
ncbi:hypothetical protein EON65_18470 [archaeon]|nr:MAG: hypothetical protein EON65_18470 [archaeon]